MPASGPLKWTRREAALYEDNLDTKMNTKLVFDRVQLPPKNQTYLWEGMVQTKYLMLRKTPLNSDFLDSHG